MIVFALAAACTDDDPPPPTATPATQNGSPAPRATATEPPADPDVGARLRYLGEYEQAADVYAAVSANSDGDDRQRALAAQAEMLVRSERFADAIPVLEQYIAEAGIDADGSLAQFMLASSQDEVAATEAAIGNYQRYIAAGGVLTPYARIERAKLLARAGRIVEANTAGEEVLAAGDLLRPLLGSFAVSMASSFEQAGADAEALAWYGRVAGLRGDVPTALGRSGAIRQRLGDPAWIADYTAAVETYPASGMALDLIAELDAAGVPVDQYTRGYANYRAFRNDAAREILAQVAVPGAEDAAEASYYLAALHERTNSFDAAIAEYARSYGLDPNSSLADDGLWWRGRLLEIAGRATEASAVYAELVTRFPASDFAGDAGFHRGLVLYRAGDPAAAAFAWGAAASAGEDSVRARALFWQGRAERDAGNRQYEETFRTLIGEEPENFYALRAEVLLGDNDDDLDEADLDDDQPDWDDIRGYLEDRGYLLGLDSPRADDERWAIADGLEDVGLHAQSQQLYAVMLADAEPNIDELYAITRRLAEEQRTAPAARAAATLIAALDDAGAEDPPDDLLRIAYPLAYIDLVEEAADEKGVSPLLLLALVRQESYYDPEAGSSAGALGLTQVIEPTGNAIASDLGVTDFELDDLFRPRLSLRFGAHYLSNQLAAFDGNAYYALAAYNGGPGTAANAIDSAGSDIELFVEDLEFEETQRYVRLVMEHYARYRQLYEDVDRPSLPE